MEPGKGNSGLRYCREGVEMHTKFHRPLSSILRFLCFSVAFTNLLFLSCVYRIPSSTVRNGGDRSSAETGEVEPGVCKGNGIRCYENTLYIAGDFTGTTDLNTGDEVNSYDSNGSKNSFLCAYSSDGSFEWAKTWGCEDGASANVISIDEAGNIFVAGVCSNWLYSNGGDENAARVVGYREKIYLGKYDSSGSLIWIKYWKAGVRGYIDGIAIDNQGAVYLAGFNTGDMDFDPGQQADMHNQGAFLIKLNNDGAYEWGLTWEARPMDVEVGTEGDIYLTGTFSGLVDLDPGESVVQRETASTLAGGYVLSLDRHGELSWLHTWGDAGENVGTGLALDSLENIFVAGYQCGELVFDNEDHPDTDRQPESDAFAAKINPAGEIIWAHTWGGIRQDRAYAIAVDSYGNALVTGFAKGDIAFDDPVFSPNLSCEMQFWDAFLVKIDPDGEYLWARVWGDQGIDVGNDLCVLDDRIYVCGTSNGELSLNIFSEDGDGI